jgi:hypothetical protein
MGVGGWEWEIVNVILRINTYDCFLQISNFLIFCLAIVKL